MGVGAALGLLELPPALAGAAIINWAVNPPVLSGRPITTTVAPAGKSDGCADWAVIPKNWVLPVTMIVAVPDLVVRTSWLADADCTRPSTTFCVP